MFFRDNNRKVNSWLVDFLLSCLPRIQVKARHLFCIFICIFSVALVVGIRRHDISHLSVFLTYFWKRHWRWPWTSIHEIWDLSPDFSRKSFHPVLLCRPRSWLLIYSPSLWCCQFSTGDLAGVCTRNIWVLRSSPGPRTTGLQVPLTLLRPVNIFPHIYNGFDRDASGFVWI